MENTQYEKMLLKIQRIGNIRKFMKIHVGQG